MDTNNEITAPGLIRMMLESRVPIEFITSLIFSRHISAIKGEGPVLVFPGFGAGDVTTLYLRNFLDGLGYDTYPWALGINLGPKEGVLDACIARVKFIYAKTGKKVSLIGHSLGGIYAREVAKLCPNETRLVISLGTPFVGDLTKTNATRLYEIIAGDTDIVNQYKLSETPPVPTTSIYSRTDGVVPWESSLQEETSQSESVEIISSHIGMVMNVHALHVIAHRLGQPHHQWKRFNSSLSAYEQIMFGKRI